MIDYGTQARELPPVARRTNGLSPEAPEPGQLVLVTGGAGYIGSVLTERLLNRGYRVRILDRLYWGRRPIESLLDKIELIEADVREMPSSALDGVDAVIHLAGLSNDPTAEYDPEANWQMNAVATETLGRNCVDRDVERVVFASSCSLYDGMAPGHARRNGSDRAARAYATSKRYGEEALIGLVDQGLCPVMLRNGTVYGYSPRMRFDLVVNTFVKDALLRGQLSLHGGGWMWRPLVDVRDVSDAISQPWRLRPIWSVARSSTFCTPTTRSVSSRCWWPARSSSSGDRSLSGRSRLRGSPVITSAPTPSWPAASASSRRTPWWRPLTGSWLRLTSRTRRC